VSIAAQRRPDSLRYTTAEHRRSSLCFAFLGNTSQPDYRWRKLTDDGKIPLASLQHK